MTLAFGTSGIRGIYGTEVTAELCIELGLGLGTSLKNKGVVVVGRDHRASSPILENAIISGLESAGVEVIQLGLVPTPVLAFAVPYLKAQAGVMITASHNPPEYNGVKLWNANGSAFTTVQEKEIESLLLKKEFKRASWESIAHATEVDVLESYLNTLNRTVSKEFKIAVDCGGGTACLTAPGVLKKYASALEELFCTVDPKFTGRASEPSEENLSELKKRVLDAKCDLGFAFDGDADRVALVDELGRFVPKDKLLALLAVHALSEKKGIIPVPVDTSLLVEDAVKEAGGEVVFTKIGDVAVLEALQKKNGVFGGEPSGCFIFPDIHLAPDGLLAAMHVLELVSASRKPLSELVDALPVYYTIREKIMTSKSELSEKVDELIARVKKLGGIQKTVELDGFRADFEDAWILVRASGTEPMVRITVEATSKKRADELLKTVLGLLE